MGEASISKIALCMARLVQAAQTAQIVQAGARKLEVGQAAQQWIPSHAVTCDGVMLQLSAVSAVHIWHEGSETNPAPYPTSAQALCLKMSLWFALHAGDLPRR